MGFRISSVPRYVWSLLALICGMLLGGFFSESLSGVGKVTANCLKAFITVVPILIFMALSPAIANLTKSGKGGKIAGSLVVWYVLTSTAAGLMGVLISSMFFEISASSVADGSTAWKMLSTLGEGGASWPFIAILGAVFVGLIAVKIPPLFRFLAVIENGIAGSSKYLSYAMAPIVFFLGVTVGVKSGAAESLRYYGLMTVYTLGLCFLWWLFYTVVLLKFVARQPLTRILKEYYLPTAIFAAGSCSSLATLPINLENAKRYGVRKEIADFVIPVGAIVNLDASALAYMAYAPFILTVVFHIPISWSALLMAWPAIVLFTIAAPGLPAGMGTALWSSTLFASLVGLTGDAKAEFIATWIALSGGIPDMFRTATNCTSDGFIAILFDKYFK